MLSKKMTHTCRKHTNSKEWHFEKKTTGYVGMDRYIVLKIN